MQTEIEIQDLFEVIETLPQDVQDVLMQHAGSESYEELNNLLEILKPLGYTFEYYLDAIPYNLSKINS